MDGPACPGKHHPVPRGPAPGSAVPRKCSQRLLPSPGPAPWLHGPASPFGSASAGGTAPPSRLPSSVQRLRGLRPQRPSRPTARSRPLEMRPRPGRCNPARPCLRSPASHACHGVALVVRWECGGRGSGRHCCLAAALPLSWRGAHLPIEAHRGVTAGAQRRVQTRSRREPQLPTAARSGARRALPSPVARQPRRAREAGHGRGGSPPWTSTASWAASDRVRTASSSRGKRAAGSFPPIWGPPFGEPTLAP